jgi:hypothetical protein
VEYSVSDTFNFLLKVLLVGLTTPSVSTHALVQSLIDFDIRQDVRGFLFLHLRHSGTPIGRPVQDGMFGCLLHQSSAHDVLPHPRNVVSSNVGKTLKFKFCPNETRVS